MGAPGNIQPAAWWVLLLLMIGGASPAFSRAKLPFAPAPSWVQPIALKTDTKVQPGEVSYGYHTLLRDSQFNLPGKTAFVHLAYKVFSEDGVQPVSEITVDFDPKYEKLLFHQVRIWRNGKLINKKNAQYKVIQQEKDLEKHIYKEELSAIIILDDVRIDDVVEYAYSLQGRNPAFGDKFFHTFYLESYDPIDEVFIRILANPRQPLYMKQENTQTKPVVATANNQQTYTWTLEGYPGKALTWIYQAVLSTLIPCLIWVPYFNISRRVKETLVNRLPEPARKKKEPIRQEVVAAGGEN